MVKMRATGPGSILAEALKLDTKFTENVFCVLFQKTRENALDRVNTRSV